MNDHSSTQKYARFAWSVLAYNLAVILWGAYVRASGSGAGCGEHWPLCNGSVIPQAAATKTLIEYSHRVSSGISLVAVVIGFFLSRRWLPEGHRSRRFATASVMFMLLEAALGAGLVLLKLVEQDASVLRAISTILHLVNTFLLLTMLMLSAGWASGFRDPATPILTAPKRKAVLGLGFALICMVGATGAIAALGDTLFPSVSFAEGFRADLKSTSHFLLRLRAIHPMLALITALVGLGISRTVLSLESEADAVTKKWAVALAGVIIAQVIFGLVNLSLLAPTWSQMIHLFLADSVLLVYVGFAATWLTERETPSLVTGLSPSRTPS